MKLERDIIVDLLPAYLSGEATAATRAAVEGYFREDPMFERQVRQAGFALESLKSPSAALSREGEKLALERARQVMQTRVSYFWVAVIFSALLPVFRIHEGKVTWLFWETSSIPGTIFSALAAFFWFAYFRLRGRTEPMPEHTVFIWLASFYTLMLGLFRIQDHRIVWLAWSLSPVIGIVFAAIAAVLWIASFVLPRMAKAGE
ncbi:MAG TPA: hypothetical protein VIX19_21355 [Terriglobales bacterium]